MPGPAATYGSPHILIILLTIGDAGAIGRQALAHKARIGEGAIRTVIKHLKGKGYITTRPQGCELTAKGRAAYSELKESIPKILQFSKSNLVVGKEQLAILVKKKANVVKNGIEQRDAAIKGGAAGATTYVIKGSKFQIPGSSLDCERDFPSNPWSKLKKELRPENGDVVIISGSDEERVSLIGALSAALTLLG